MSYQSRIQIETGYIECMLWTEEEELEGSDHISDELRKSIVEDIESFSNQADGLIVEAITVKDDYYLDNVGHDFWLTRNGHGTGFWDRGLPSDIGDKLSKIAEGFKPFDIYVNSNNKIEGEQSCKD